jgi:outer membrane immunogenic protein
MNKLLTTIIALTALAAGPAIAADIPAKAPVVKAPPPAPVFSWTGFYSATVVGGGWEEINGTYAAFPTTNHNTDQSRGWWGSLYGVQYQWNNIVLGVEGGYSRPFDDDYGQSLSVSPDCLDGGAPVPDRTCQSRLRGYWQAGGKVGFAFNNVLLYGTGGYANGRIQTQTLVTSAPTVITSFTSARHTGWYAGAGIDYYVTKLWWSDLILGVEYQHVEFDSKLHNDLLPGATGINNRFVDATLDVIRARITFKYSPEGIVRARY